MAFALNSQARLPLAPANGASVTRRQDSHHVTDRPIAPPKGAFDTGLRHQAFPPDAASLLPGALALTGTGLSPAGRCELTFRSGHLTAPPPNSGHTKVPLDDRAVTDGGLAGPRFRTASAFLPVRGEMAQIGLAVHAGSSRWPSTKRSTSSSRCFGGSDTTPLQNAERERQDRERQLPRQSPVLGRLAGYVASPGREHDRGQDSCRVSRWRRLL
jgi:hypothetical protein